MTEISIIGKPTSDAMRDISKNAKIPVYDGKIKADVIVNYGLSEINVIELINKFPRARKIPMLNRVVGHSKLKVVTDAKKAGILVPDSMLSLPKNENKENWIEKKIYSSKGIGIVRATSGVPIHGKYYQKIVDKRYELRVHAFKWIPKENWCVQKRVGDKDKIAWNYHQGGKFKPIYDIFKFKVFRDAIDISDKILDLTDMAFGAVDLIVSPQRSIYFIEVNSAPGFTALSRQIYVAAFLALKTMKLKDILKWAG